MLRCYMSLPACLARIVVSGRTVIAVVLAVLLPGGVLFPQAAVAQTILGQGVSLVPQIAHAGQVNQARFCPQVDFPLLATASNDGTVRLWDLFSRRLMRTIEVGRLPVMGIDWSAVGPPVLFAACLDGSVSAWDSRSGVALWRLPKWHSSGATVVRSSPDGRLLASAGRDGVVRVWQPLAGAGAPRLFASMRLTDGEYAADLAWNPKDPRRLAAATNRGGVFVWSVEIVGGREAPAPVVRPVRNWSANGEENDCIAWSPDGITLAVGTSFGRVRLLPGQKTIEVDKPVQAVAWRDNAHLATGDSDGRVRVWDRRSGANITNLPSTGGWIEDIAFSPQTRWLVSVGSIFSHIDLWDSQSGQRLPLSTGLSGDAVTLLAFDFAGAQPGLLVGRAFSTVQRWDFTLVGPVPILPIFSSAPLGSDTGAAPGPFVSASATATVAEPPGSTILALGRSDGHVTVFRRGLRGPGPPLLDVPAHSQSVHAVTLAPRLGLVASVGLNDTPRIYLLVNGTLRARPEPAESPTGSTGSALHPRCLQFSPKEDYLALGTAEGEIILWESVRWKQRARWHAHDGTVNGIAFSPDGTRLVSVGNDGKTQVWEISANGTTLRRQLGPTQTSVMCVAWSADGNLIVTGDLRGGVRFLPPDGTAARTEASMFGGTAVTAIAITPDGKAIITGAADGTAQLWAHDGRPVATFLSDAAGEWMTVLPSGVYASSRGGTHLAAFRVDARAYPFDQFDLIYNRPDLVLTALAGVAGNGSGGASAVSRTVEMYYAAYVLRCRQRGESPLPTGVLPAPVSPPLPHVESVELVP